MRGLEEKDKDSRDTCGPKDVKQVPSMDDAGPEHAHGSN